MEIREAREVKAQLATRIREMAQEFEANGKEWKDSAAEENFRKLNDDYNANEAVIGKLEAARKVAEAVARTKAEKGLTPDTETEIRSNKSTLRGKSVDEVKCLAFGAAMASSGARLSDAEYDALDACGMTGSQGDFRFNLLDSEPHAELQAAFRAGGADAANAVRQKYKGAALVTTTPTSGGNFVPPESLLTAVEVNMLAFGGVLQVADTMTTSTGETTSWLTFDDTSNSGRRLAENAAHDDNAGGGTSGDGGPNPTFSKTSWESYDYTSDTILVPYRLLRDSAANLPSLLGAAMGERLGRILNSECTTGTGSSQPQGIVTGATVGVTAAGTAAITLDEVYQLQHSLDPAYRTAGMGAAFMCNDSVALHLRLKKDSENRYLWQSGFNTGAPDTLAGSPLYYNHDMANLAASSKSLLFGALSYYKVRRVAGIRFYRLTERYRHRDQDGFVAMMSADGGVLNAGTAPIKTMQQAAS